MSKQSEKKLGSETDTLRGFYDAATLLMGTVKLANDDIIHVSDNRATAAFFATTAEAMRGKSTRALGVPEHYRKLWLEAYRTSLRSGEPVRFDYYHEPKGWLKVTVDYIGTEDGEPRFSYVADDITDRKRDEQAVLEARDSLELRVRARTQELEDARADLLRANRQLQHDAFHDALTGLPNRALFADRLGRSIERVKRRPEVGYAVLFFDLDHFKVVNDSLGHEVGDQLLVAVGRAWSACIRETDTLARLGGDEFTLLLEDCTLARAAEVIERLQGALAAPFELRGRELFVSASIGVVLSHPAYTRPEEVIRDADTAMYRAKAEGPGHYVVFDETMRDQADRRFDLGSELARGLERREFRVYYQPIVSLAEGRLVGFEALVRWQHPERGLLHPGDFIAVAEETGLIVELDRYVLRAACEQLSSWQTQFSQTEPVSAAPQEFLSLNVNFSSRQFGRRDLFRFVEQTLLETGLRAGSLNLEITESLLMDRLESVDLMTAQLRALGVGLYLDDFGTGYSSLAYLQRFPADVLKIDRSFVQPLLSSAQSAELVRTVLVMAQALGMGVVAEGIETREVAAQLGALGCEYGQGYLFAEPLSAEEAEAFIADAGQTAAD